MMTIIDLSYNDHRVVEFAPLKLCADASDLGLLPGTPLPSHIGTDKGNGEPFDFHHTQTNNDGELIATIYLQRFGCLWLHILND